METAVWILVGLALLYLIVRLTLRWMFPKDR
jgi:hypothetical protein